MVDQMLLLYHPSRWAAPRVPDENHRMLLEISNAIKRGSGGHYLLRITIWIQNFWEEGSQTGSVRMNACSSATVRSYKMKVRFKQTS